VTSFFTDREFGSRPVVTESINDRVWSGLHALIVGALDDASFGYRFPDYCNDGQGECGCNVDLFSRVLAAEIPEIDWPLSEYETPETPVILDLLEFCAASIGEPIQGDFHSFWRHYHLSWDRESGLAAFTASVNKLFQRNGIAFEMSPSGEVHRKLDQTTTATLCWNSLETGDERTNNLLNTSIKKFLSPKTADRFDATEKLWDAFERLKTLEVGSNKKIQANLLLDKAAQKGSKFREAIGQESKELTTIGNTFNIRHSETSQEQISNLEQNDYLYIRLFCFIKLLLQSLGRTN